MAQAKIELTVGNVSFSGEGEESWLSEQLEKVLDVATTLTVQQPDPPEGESEDPDVPVATANTGDFKTSLVNHIRDKKAESNQVQRFLAAADWLRRRGATTLTSSGVAKVLADNHQKRLANASDCLNKNVSKGYCEKTKTGFFIAPDGLKHLGYT